MAGPIGDLPLRMARLVQPLGDLGRVEPNQPAYLEVRHPPLGDETADVADRDSELLSELVDSEELGQGRRL